MGGRSVNFVITEKGREIQAKLLEGGRLIYTKAEAGADYSASPTKLLAVQSPKQSVQIESVDVEDGNVKLVLLITNVDLSEEYLLKQIGIYAKTDDSDEEYLIIIGQDLNGERIPANTDRIVQYYHTLTMTTSNAYSVEVAVNSADLVNKKLFYSELEKKVDSDGGDLENTVLTFNDFSDGSEKPSAAQALAAIKSKIRLPKFAENFLAFCSGCVTLAMIVDNCVSDRSDLVASARQLKLLQEQITKLNGEVTKCITSDSESSTVGKHGRYIVIGDMVISVFILRSSEEIAGYSESVSVPIPKYGSMTIYDTTHTAKFQINDKGIFQNADTLKSGKYVTFAVYIKE
jgi:hypothetical protein